MKEKFEKWATEFLNSPTEAMSKEMSEIFLMSTMAEMGGKTIPEEMRSEFLFKVIEARAKVIGLSLSDWAKVFLMFLTKSPGSAIMHLYALRSDGTEYNMSQLTNKFPMGFLSETQMSKMWDAQKGNVLGIDGVDNMLDHYKF